MQQEKIPKVSVCVLAYNHEIYIRQCLQSIVEQETDFDFEVIVGADLSTDNTQEIVREFAERYPEVVLAKFEGENIGATKNYLSTHALARGQYVAHIDGDDMMLPGKLFVQAQYLSKNSDVVAVWHRVKTLARDGNLTDASHMTEVEPVSQRIVLQRGFAGHHSSLMYRRAKKPTLSHSDEILDLQISVELLKNGLGAILPNVLGIYREGLGIMVNDKNLVRRLAKKCLDYYLGVYPEYRCEINRCAFSLFIREMANGGHGAAQFLHTFLNSLNIRTPLSVGSECLLITQKTFARLYSRVTSR